MVVLIVCIFELVDVLLVELIPEESFTKPKPTCDFDIGCPCPLILGEQWIFHSFLFIFQLSHQLVDAQYFLVLFRVLRVQIVVFEQRARVFFEHPKPGFLIYYKYLHIHTSMTSILTFILQYKLAVISMLSDFLSSWSSATLKQKYQILKQAVLQLAIISVVAFTFFWSTFIFTWLLTWLIGVQPYYVNHTPSFHVRSLMPSSLLTVYINKSIKQQACDLGPEHIFFSELTVPYHEYCNIDQQSLPYMKSLVDITVSQIDFKNIQYITGCIKHRNKDISCQKYPASSAIQIFRNVDFYGLYYLQIQLNLRQKDSTPLSYYPFVEFDEKCWLITKLIKKYYSVLMLFFSYGITVLLTICIIIFRLGKVAKKNYQKKQIEQIQKVKFGQNQLKRISKSNLSKIQPLNPPIPPQGVISAPGKQMQKQQIKQQIGKEIQKNSEQKPNSIIKKSN